jgi:hypothetical protein
MGVLFAGATLTRIVSGPPARKAAMSAPKTNLDKQRRRHAVPLIGMGLVVVFGALLIVLLLFRQVERAPDEVPSPSSEGAVVSPQTPETIGPDVPEGVPGGTTAPPAPPASRQQPVGSD